MLEGCDVTRRPFEWSEKLKDGAGAAEAMEDELARERAKLTSTPWSSASSSK